MLETAANLSAVINYSEEELAQMKLEKDARTDEVCSLSAFALSFYYPAFSNLAKLVTSQKQAAKADYIWLGHWNHLFFNEFNFFTSFHSSLSPRGSTNSCCTIFFY